MTSYAQRSNARPLTGRKVLAIAVAAFGTIIAVNLTLAYSAVRTFPGVEVKNGYVASQSFERERAAQARLGWTSSARYRDGELTVRIVDRKGAPVWLREAAFRIGRPTTEARDLPMETTATGWAANLDLAPGLWRLDIVGATATGERFRQHLTLEGGE